MFAEVNCFDGLLEQLEGTRKNFENSLNIGTVAASVNVAELLSVTKSLKTLENYKIRWEGVTNCLIKEAKLLSSIRGVGAQANKFLSTW